MVFFRKKIFKIIVLVSLMFFLIPGVVPLQAKTLTDAYEKLKTKPEYASLINELTNKLTATGKVTENEINQFILDLSNQLAQENLTLANFEDEFYRNVVELILKNKALLAATFQAFPQEINDFLKVKKLPPQYAGLMEALKQEMTSHDGSSPGPGGGSGGGETGGDSTGVKKNIPVSEEKTELKQPVSPAKKEGATQLLITFKDVPTNHWAKQDIELMATLGIVKGVGKDTFKPNDKVTRAEFTAFIQRALDLPLPDTNSPEFLDVSQNAWFYTPVKAVSAANIIKGTKRDYFEPYRFITREEMATVIMRAYMFTAGSLYQNPGPLTFTDASQISSWAKDAVAVSVKLGVVKGINEQHFNPKGQATRAQAVVMIKRLLGVSSKTKQ
jgi:hypothetical protein